MDLERYCEEALFYDLPLDDATVHSILSSAARNSDFINGTLVPSDRFVMWVIIDALVREKRKLIKELTEWELGKKRYCGPDGGFWDLSQRQPMGGYGRSLGCPCDVQGVPEVADSEAADREDAEQHRDVPAVRVCAEERCKCR